MNNILIKLLVSTILLVLFTGCLPKKNVEVDYPTWYNQIQKDSLMYLYGVGESETKKGATAIALNEVASKITVEIESSYSINTQMSGTKYTKSIKRNIKNNIKKIEFTNYKIIKEKVLNNNRYVVLVQVDRLDLASALKIKIDNKIKKFRSIVSTKYSNFTHKLKELKKIQKSIESLKSDIFILNSLDEMMNIKPLLKSLEKIESKIESIKNKTTINVKSDNNDDYAKVLSSIITKEGFSIVSNNATLNITIKSKEQKINSMGNKIIKASLEIVVLDKNKKQILGKKRFITGGKSRSNFSQAHEFSVRNFNKKIIRDNILGDLLGI